LYRSWGERLSRPPKRLWLFLSLSEGMPGFFPGSLGDRKTMNSSY
jgi:hypothetical protein